MCALVIDFCAWFPLVRIPSTVALSFPDNTPKYCIVVMLVTNSMDKTATWDAVSRLAG
jgi:hypothetical protein